MFDKNQALRLIFGASTHLEEAMEKLEEIRKEDGELSNLKQKRNAVRRPLDDVEEALSDLRKLVNSAVIAPPAPPPDETDAGGTEAGADAGEAGGGAVDAGAGDAEPDAGDAGGAEPGADDAGAADSADDQPVPIEPPPPDDLFSIEDQHAVSKLMQDTAVHLAVIRKRKFWEIRHRNTADGRPSDAIRARTIAEAYEKYDQEVVRRGNFQPFEPRALTPEEQRALQDFHDMPLDHPRSVRWEAAMTEVDYIDRHNHHAGGRSDDVEFPPGSLVGPVEHLKTVLS